MTLGVKLGDTITARGSTLVAIILMFFSYLILIIFPKYKYVILGMSIFGIGDGLGNLSVIKNCWRYFPNNKGLVNGIILTGFGTSTAVLSPVADYLINYNKEGTDSQGYYSAEVSLNLLIYLKFVFYLIIILGTISIILTFPYENENKEEEENNFMYLKYDKENNDEEIMVNENENVNENESLSDAFFSIPNLELGLLIFCGPCKIFK